MPVYYALFRGKKVILEKEMLETYKGKRNTKRR